MSELRRKRQEAREGIAQPNPAVRNVIVAVLIVVVFGVAYYFIRRKQDVRMNAFAQCLTVKQAKMYGAFWCPHCADQKELFGSSFQYAPYIECGIKGSHEMAPVCAQAEIKHFPTWVFADGTRIEGSHPLEFLSEKTGCSLP
jgi:hypothetical protein